ncbi:MAG: hypothetical protein A4E58_01998 [Syntrophorhabdus sp. PtaB.Bin006]|nr:MAG: hypothetical protein A4E58_01998 [Syntrophorhabdus sp. PtaB.Bin006]
MGDIPEIGQQDDISLCDQKGTLRTPEACKVENIVHALQKTCVQIHCSHEAENFLSPVFFHHVSPKFVLQRSSERGKSVFSLYVSFERSKAFLVGLITGFSFQKLNVSLNRFLGITLLQIYLCQGGRQNCILVHNGLVK